MVVRSFIALFITMGAINTYAEAPLYDADSLRDRISNNASHKKTINERLKAAQGNTKTLRLLQEGDINYKLPNGSYVLGMLLPNGKVAPAHSRNGRRYPACVTIDYKLVPGQWDEKRNAIICPLTQSQLAFVGDNVALSGAAPQVSSLSETPQATKYAATHSTDNKPNESDAENNKNHNKTEEIKSSIHKKTANKYSKNSNSNSNSNSKKDQSTTITNNTVTSDMYVPPPRNGSSSKTVAGVIKIDRSKFGIPIGTWAKAELMRPVSSAERGLIEYILIESIEGKYRSLPAGTILFANKSINEDDRRMESITQIARLPDDEEVNVSARIYSLDKSAGITGTLVRDRQSEFSGSTSRAALKAISASVPELSTISGAAVESITNDTINRENKYLQNIPNAVIRVSPQAVLVKIAASF